MNFIENKDVKFLCRTLFEVDLTPTQEEIVRIIAFKEHKRVVISAMTRYGKSMCLSLGVLLFILFNKDKKIGLIAPIEKQTQIIRNYIATFALKSDLLKELIEIDVTGIERIKKEVSRSRITFKNGCSLQVLSAEGTGARLMGYGFELLVIDEIGDIKLEVYEERISRMLGDTEESTLVAIGNPWNRDSIFYRHWTDTKFKKLKIDWRTAVKENRVTEEFINEQRELLKNNPSAFCVLYDAEFPSESEDSLFRWDWINRATLKEPIKKEDIIKEEILAGLDVAEMGCFDDKTEILTNKGFKLFNNLIGNELVLSVNTTNRNLSWEKIDKIHKYKYKGYLNYANARTYNFAITDNHKLPYIPYSSEKTTLKRFDELPKEFKILDKVNWEGKNNKHIIFNEETKMPNGGIRKKEHIFDMKDWADFLGWFVSEGCVVKEKRRNINSLIYITQKKGTKKWFKIKELLERMNLKYSIINTGAFRINNKEIGNHLLKHCKKYAKNKRIPNYIKEGTKEIISIFLFSFLLGDGTINNKGSKIYYSTSTLLIDDLQECLIKLGLAGSIKLSNKAGTKFEIEGRIATRLSNCYTLYSKKIPNDKTIMKNKFYKKKYDGTIYCISTKNKTFLSRREGISSWSGNSDLTVLTILKKVNETYEVIDIKHWGKKDTMQTVGICLGYLENYKNLKELKVDATGVGKGVYDRFKELKTNKQITFIPIDIKVGRSPEKPKDKLVYLNQKAEFYFQLRYLFEEGKIKIPEERNLITQLRDMKYEKTSNQKIKIIDPENKSPDFSDSLVLAISWSNRLSFSFV